MKYFLKKIYFSMFLSIFVLLTVVTTTLAWYSTNQNVIIDDFHIGISGKNGDSSSLRGIELSLDGINFSDELAEIDVKRAILLQKGFASPWSMSDNDVLKEFKQIKFTATTPKNYLNLSEGFEVVNRNLETLDAEYYLSFDLYVSTNDYGDQVSDEKMDLYFQNDDMAECEDVNAHLAQQLPTHPTLGDIPQDIKVNAKNACRIGYVLYETMERGIPVSSNQIDSKIYSLSQNQPSVVDGVYNFGGINNEYNAMIKYYNMIMSHNYKPLEIPQSIKGREDDLIYSKQIFGQ